VKDKQAELMMDPFCSSLAEGPLQKGYDLIQGGAWYTTYGLYLAGLADTADSLAIIDKLIYLDKKITGISYLKLLKVIGRDSSLYGSFVLTTYLSTVMTTTSLMIGRCG